MTDDPFVYRDGVPMTPAAAEAFDAYPDEDKPELLRRLDMAAFEAVTTVDIDRLPSTDPR